MSWAPVVICSTGYRQTTSSGPAFLHSITCGILLLYSYYDLFSAIIRVFEGVDGLHRVADLAFGFLDLVVVEAVLEGLYRSRYVVCHLYELDVVAHHPVQISFFDLGRVEEACVSVF